VKRGGVETPIPKIREKEVKKEALFIGFRGKKGIIIKPQQKE